jgi:predicted metal-dependent phosphoesterase TrpH
MEPSKILKCCKKLGFDVVSITDHDSLKGSLEAKKYEKDFNIKVVVGAEIKTDLGDIIGLNLNEEIKARQFNEVIDEIKDQGGISVLPHPSREHKNVEQIASKVDLIEVFNSRSTFIENRKSFELVCDFNKPYLSGSDAHLYTEISNSIMYFDDLLGYNKIYNACESKKFHKIQSHVIRDIKLQKYHLLPFHLMRLIF